MAEKRKDKSRTVLHCNLKQSIIICGIVRQRQGVQKQLSVSLE